MLKDLHADQARSIADLAKRARAQRDALLGNVAVDDLGGLTPARGEGNPTAEFGAGTGHQADLAVKKSARGRPSGS